MREDSRKLHFCTAIQGGMHGIAPDSMRKTRKESAMKPLILTDSASDVTNADGKDLRVLPMKIFFGDEEYLDTVNLTHQEFYTKLIESNALPTTSQIPPYEFEQAFAEAKQEGRAVVAVTIGQKFSGTYQSAVIAAENSGAEVYVIDSECVSIGERLLVDYAYRLADQGCAAKDIAAEVERVKPRLCIIALLDTLEYLKAGGRISRTVALAGGLLNIKPVVSVIDGQVVMIGKARGSKNGHNLLREEIAAHGGVDFRLPYHLGYTGLDDTMLRKYVEDNADLWRGELSKLPVCTIGGTIGTHVGPGAICVAFFAPEQ
jgi:DegV family protein with EDD domain